MYICVYAYIHMYIVKSQNPTCSQGVFLQTFSSSWNICVLSVKAKGVSMHPSPADANLRSVLTSFRPKEGVFALPSV